MVVEDMDALDAAIAAYVAEGQLAGRTRANYDKWWRFWVRHCQARGVDPLSAPMTAFEDLWLLRGEDGRLLGPTTVKSMATAVSHHYREQGLTPAHKRPENAGTWGDLSRGAVRRAATQRSRGEGEERDAVPLMRTDAAAMLATQPRWSHAQRKDLAEMLLVFDLHPVPGELDRLTRADVELGDDGSVTVAGLWLECDHDQRVRGVPWDCTACAVRGVAAPLAGDDLLLNRSKRPRGQYWAKRLRRLSPLMGGRGPHPGLTDWQEAGLRRLLVLGTTQDGLRWARARAWTGVAWSCGLRMGSDTERLERSAFRPDRADRGWSLVLGATKDDPAGAKQVTRPFGWGGAGSVSVVDALVEWLCVRDARFGRVGAAFPSINTRTAGQMKHAAMAATEDLRLLAELAGIEPIHTSYSTRKGYAAQAAADGWPVEDIQEGLRHLHLSTTVAHYLPAVTAREVATRFVGKLELDAGGAL